MQLASNKLDDEVEEGGKIFKSIESDEISIQFALCKE